MAGFLRGARGRKLCLEWRAVRLACSCYSLLPYGAFAFVQRDEDPVLPVGGNAARSPDTSEEEV